MARPRGRPPRTADRKEQILDAALHCFVEKGFHGTAMPEIADRADIAAGTIYHYFESKEALVNALYRRWKAEVTQRVFAAFPQGAPTRQQFAAVWKEMASFALAHPEAFAFLELHNHASYLDDESLAVDRNLKDFAARMVERAQVDGVVKPVAATVLMELVFGAFTGLFRAGWERRFRLNQALIEGAEQICWDAISVH
jgi:AcrR family transcriptional regulator